MSRRVNLNPGEEIMYRTRTPVVFRFLVHYFMGCLTAPLFGIGLIFLFGWGFYMYSDVLITNQRVLLRKSGFLRSLRGHRSIPFDQIYLNTTLRDVAIQRVELDLVDGKTVHIAIPRANVFVARLHEAIRAKNA